MKQPILEDSINDNEDVAEYSRLCNCEKSFKRNEARVYCPHYMRQSDFKQFGGYCTEHVECDYFCRECGCRPCVCD
jgi:hypothetical protein